jgi:peptide deformylase
MRKILQKDSKILRAKSREVELEEIRSPKIVKALAEMKTALDACDDGVALAAPQIGYSLRIFIVSGRYFDEKFRERPKEEYEKGIRSEDTVFINPRLIKKSAKKAEVDEGCLSARWLYGKMKRSEKATVEAYDENGEKITRGASGLLAQIFQHEIDHLNGILFLDNAKEIVEVKPDGQKK